eukprot:scaffold13150_cov125-Isochrysis_galbana.AAC.3
MRHAKERVIPYGEALYPFSCGSRRLAEEHAVGAAVRPQPESVGRKLRAVKRAQPLVIGRRRRKRRPHRRRAAGAERRARQPAAAQARRPCRWVRAPTRHGLARSGGRRGGRGKGLGRSLLREAARAAAHMRTHGRRRRRAVCAVGAEAECELSPSARGHPEPHRLALAHLAPFGQQPHRLPPVRAFGPRRVCERRLVGVVELRLPHPHHRVGLTGGDGGESELGVGRRLLPDRRLVHERLGRQGRVLGSVQVDGRVGALRPHPEPRVQGDVAAGRREQLGRVQRRAAGVQADECGPHAQPARQHPRPGDQHPAASGGGRKSEERLAQPAAVHQLGQEERRARGARRGLRAERRRLRPHNLHPVLRPVGFDAAAAEVGEAAEHLHPNHLRRARPRQQQRQQPRPAANVQRERGGAGSRRPLQLGGRAAQGGRVCAVARLVAQHGKVPRLDEHTAPCAEGGDRLSVFYPDAQPVAPHAHAHPGRRRDGLDVLDRPLVWRGHRAASAGCFPVDPHVQDDRVEDGFLLHRIDRVSVASQIGKADRTPVGETGEPPTAQVELHQRLEPREQPAAFLELSRDCERRARPPRRVQRTQVDTTHAPRAETRRRPTHQQPLRN